MDVFFVYNSTVALCVDVVKCKDKTSLGKSAKSKTDL